MSAASMAAAFVALGVVFSVGLMLMAFLRAGPAPPPKTRSIPPISQLGRAAPSGGAAAATDATAREVARQLDEMRPGDSLAVAFHSPTCAWCAKLRAETIAPMQADGSLPMPVRIVEATPGISRAHRVLSAIAPHVRGLPTFVVIMRRRDGHYFHPIVGFQTRDALLRRVSGAAELAVRA